jgi:hypothetical protein
MNRPAFKYDVFISAAQDDLSTGKELYDSLRKNGISSYLYTDNRIADDFEKKILGGLATSEYFVVLASPNACQSSWVKREHEIFSEYEAKDSARKIFRMKIGKGCPELLPGKIIHADTINLLVPEVVRYYVEQRRRDCSELAEAVQHVETQLAKRDGEAFNHYRRSRFWRPLTNDYNVHIFTCGRDTPPGDGAPRPSRTTIDKWDYRTVLDITHFMNRHYPATHVQIEDPVSKLSATDLKQQSAVGRVAKLQALLRNKNCIIIGSPDVSDFAEIVLAETHKMEPYDSRRDVKQTGYVIIKDAANVSAPSSLQWTAGEGEEPGVAKLTAEGPQYFPARTDAKGGSGEMCGILAVVSNPFSDAPGKHRIVLLSGFSGVATNAIAKFLTHDDYLVEFGRFDREYVNVETNVEVLIGVHFKGASQAHGDRRDITGVAYRGLVEV